MTNLNGSVIGHQNVTTGVAVKYGYAPEAHHALDVEYPDNWAQSDFVGAWRTTAWDSTGKITALGYTTETIVIQGYFTIITLPSSGFVEHLFANTALLYIPSWSPSFTLAVNATTAKPEARDSTDTSGAPLFTGNNALPIEVPLCYVATVNLTAGSITVNYYSDNGTTLYSTITATGLDLAGAIGSIWEGRQDPVSPTSACRLIYRGLYIYESTPGSEMFRVRTRRYFAASDGSHTDFTPVGTSDRVLAVYADDLDQNGETLDSTLAGNKESKILQTAAQANVKPLDLICYARHIAVATDDSGADDKGKTGVIIGGNTYETGERTFGTDIDYHQQVLHSFTDPSTSAAWLAPALTAQEIIFTHSTAVSTLKAQAMKMDAILLDAGIELAAASFIDPVDRTSYTLASVTSRAGCPLIIRVATGKTTADVTPTLSGGGWTYNVIANSQWNTGNRMIVYRADPTTSATFDVAIDLGGVTHLYCSASAYNLTNTVAGAAFLSQAVVIGTNSTDTPTATLSTLSTGDAILAFFGATGTAVTIEPNSPLVEILEQDETLPTRFFSDGWAVDGGTTAPSATLAVGGANVCIAIVVKVRPNPVHFTSGAIGGIGTSASIRFAKSPATLTAPYGSGGSFVFNITRAVGGGSVQYTSTDYSVTNGPADIECTAVPSLGVGEKIYRGDLVEIVYNGGITDVNGIPLAAFTAPATNTSGQNDPAGRSGINLLLI